MLQILCEPFLCIFPYLSLLHLKWRRNPPHKPSSPTLATGACLSIPDIGMSPRLRLLARWNRLDFLFLMRASPVLVSSHKGQNIVVVRRTSWSTPELSPPPSAFSGELLPTLSHASWSPRPHLSNVRTLLPCRAPEPPERLFVPVAGPEQPHHRTRSPFSLGFQVSPSVPVSIFMLQTR